jgi:hypothetical protein
MNKFKVITTMIVLTLTITTSKASDRPFTQKEYEDHLKKIFEETDLCHQPDSSIVREMLKRTEKELSITDTINERIRKEARKIEARIRAFFRSINSE